MNGVKVKTVLDTGSPIYIMSTRDVLRIKPQIYRPINKTARYTDFHGNEVKLTGEMEINTNYGNKSLTTSWMIIEGDKEPIIGMNNIPKLGIEIFTGGKLMQINK